MSEPDPQRETDAMSEPDPSGQEPTLPAEQSRIIIKPNGEVIIENLSMSLLELAQLLDPDSEVACSLPDVESDEGEPEAESE